REGKGPQGTIAGQSIMTWDSSAKAYAMITINSNGASVLVHGTPAGGVWTWNGTLDIAGRALQVRLTTTLPSPPRFTINSNGASVLVHGTPAGGVWTWNGTLDIAGRALKVRLTTTSQSPSAYTFDIEGSIDGKWISLEKGRVTRVS